jgi:hypothetical protein
LRAARPPEHCRKERAMSRLTVLNPKVSQPVAKITGATRVADLKGAVIGFVDNSKQNADHFIARVGALLQEQYGIAAGVQVRKHAPKDELGERDLAELAKCAAVVQCYGD